jgi:uncharacterized peroxidase-related enzyme
MAPFPIPTLETASENVRPIFESVKRQFGSLPNLYAVIGTSARTLEAYLQFQNTLSEGAFTKKEIQAIFLAVSQVNDCVYCLSVHTAIAKMTGFTEEETYALRLASVTDKRLRAITGLARAITLSRGHPQDTLMQSFFDVGFDNAALIELIALVADKTLANYVNNVVNTPIDFPIAKVFSESVSVN